MLVEFTQEIRTRTVVVGVTAGDVQLVEAIVEEVESGGTRTVGSHLTLKDGNIIFVHQTPEFVVATVNEALTTRII